jgi:hypothetical protein
MRDCDRSMTKKAGKNLMNSNAYNEKPCFLVIFVQAQELWPRLWRNAGAHRSESRVISDVRF